MNQLEQLKREGNLLAKPVRPKKPKKGLRRIGVRGAKRKAEYAPVERAHLNENPVCQVGAIWRAHGFRPKCLKRATHCHHVRGRHGPLLTDRRFLLSACDGECHVPYVHQSHVGDAWLIGLLQPQQLP